MLRLEIRNSERSVAPGCVWLLSWCAGGEEADEDSGPGWGFVDQMWQKRKV